MGGGPPVAGSAARSDLRGGSERRDRGDPCLVAVAGVALLLLFAAGCATSQAPSAGVDTGGEEARGDVRVEAWESSDDGARALDRVQMGGAGGATAVDAATVRAATVRITIEPDRRYQAMLGFGAAITDASAWLIRHRMSPAQRGALLRDLFGRADGGLGFDFTRLTIGASDFSRSHYSLDDMPAGQVDPELRRFSIERNRDDVIPVVREALAINPGLKVMASPWSAPGWMKTSGSLVSGSLLPRWYEAFARYLVRYVDAYAAEGIPIFALTLQNEPAFEPDDYPGMRLPAAARARIIGDHLGRMLAARAPRVQIFDWDHNWDQPEQPLAVLRDPQAAPYVAAVAWHCYGGDVAAQSRVHAAFPDRDVYMTECSGGDWEPVRSGGIVGQVRGLVIGATRHHARGVLFWNLALDERRGPHAGGCDTCRGVVTIDSASGRVARTEDYYALAHASRFVRPGARRIGSSEGRDEVDNVAFRNADDGSLVLVASNAARAPRRLAVEAGDQGAFVHVLPARSVATFVWHPSRRQGAAR